MYAPSSIALPLWEDLETGTLPAPRLSQQRLRKARLRLLEMHWRSGVGHLGGNLSALDAMPILFKPEVSIRFWFENRLRRLFDLQAGSIWRDMRLELIQARGRLLDVGCGAQIYRELLPAQVVYRGIDSSSAKANFGYDIPDTHYFDGDDWGVADDNFDTVLCTEVLEHILDPGALLARASRCLRPTGRLILTVPFAARWHFIPYDYWRFTPAGLYRLLTEAGLDNIRVQARGNPLTVACYKLMTLHFILLCGGNKGLIKIVKYTFGIIMLPLLCFVAFIANISLLSDWGEDCLGYTVTARRMAQPPQSSGENSE